MPSIAELIEALPPEADEQRQPLEQLRDLLEDLSSQPIPVGRLTRMWSLGTLQAKIAAAYLAWWIRTGISSPDEKQRQLDETHLRMAISLLGRMGYLRGAVMKVGQILATYPDVVPQQFADILGRLHFEAPPMHFSLLRELVRGELGADPEDLFDDFETDAFAAASLGQVHRARHRATGRPLAIKIQYPDIARTIRDDLGNMRAIVAPMRVSGDWDSLVDQFDDIRRMLDLETDYEQEAEHLRIARGAFREGEGIVVPRVYGELSTRRVLTMDFLEGVHLEAFLETGPPQTLRNAQGDRIVLATMRLSYGAHLLYADPHPGNYMFMPDGRLGLLDFGCCHRYSADDVDYMDEIERSSLTSRDAVRRALVRATDMTARQQQDERRFELLMAWCDWLWEPVFHEGPFDFGDPSYFRRGLEIYGEVLKRRYVRSVPLNTWLTKSFMGLRAVLTHLGARCDYGAIMRRETTVRTES